MYLSYASRDLAECWVLDRFFSGCFVVLSPYHLILTETELVALKLIR